jgi:electron transfer flavoprotein beta subunit
MKIYVCIKHVPDSAATITVKDGSQIEENITFLMNPYDEHAVTEAVRLKEQFPDSEIIAVCLGKAAAENTLRSAMAMGADRGILIAGDDRHDSLVTARVLKAAIENDGCPDVILTGKESIDNEGMQTMFRLAHHFGIPAATNVVQIDVQNEVARVACEKEAGTREVFEMRLPCVVAAGKGLNTPRYPTFPDIVKSRKKPVDTIAMEDLPIETPAGGVEVVRYESAAEPRHPKALAGSAESIAAQLVALLRDEARVL